ncbi:polysaccharide deacetylase family protein [Chitinolyticbacter albus]|uniref:polysaccharide deacetylase family protein n=1 Tax=Chitinolyticbacter albus TaxID=2961951 RepID=UPI00210D39AD|nr:polysaccharide deacetylase family protein [Chitinolyticbacter albus]
MHWRRAVITILTILVLALAAAGWWRYGYVPAPPAPSAIPEATLKARQYVRTPFTPHWDQVPLAEFERQAKRFPGQLWLEGRTHRKLIALTFDDGPTYNTPRLLDVLARHKVKATFFWLGREMMRFPEAVRRAAREGHLLGNHTWDHPDISGLDETTLWDEQIGATQAVFKQILGTTPHLMRPPYGRIADWQVEFMRRQGLRVIQWSVDAQDWNRARMAFGSHLIERDVQDYIHPEAIVLMHDGGGPREDTVAAVDRLIPWLRAAGYEFVTIDQLLDTHPYTGPGQPRPLPELAVDGFVG